MEGSDPSLCQFLMQPHHDINHWPNNFWWLGIPILKNVGYALDVYVQLKTLQNDLIGFSIPKKKVQAIHC